MSNNGERIAKIIARSGLASRRAAERMVADGRVVVNGKTVHHPGHTVDPKHDLIKVDNKPLPPTAQHVYFILHKPRGTITGRDDPEGRKSVLDLVAHLPVRVEPVGRLDMDTEGALLMTNDGAMAHKLTHPSSGVPKRYLAKVWRVPTEKTLNRIRSGIRLEDGKTAPCKARVVETTDGDNAWVEITVTEGRNRVIRRLFEAVGHPVSKLRRESFATIALKNLERGSTRPLESDEIRRLQDIMAGKDPRNAGHGTRYRPGFARPKARKTRKNQARKGRGTRRTTSDRRKRS